MKIDLQGVTSSEELHKLLSHCFRFPKYYGKNWDAFYDCISDIFLSACPSQIEFVGYGKLINVLPKEALQLKICIEDALGEDSDCSCKLLWN